MQWYRLLIFAMLSQYVGAQDCDAGRYTFQTSAGQTCPVCDAGFYSSAANTNCISGFVWDCTPWPDKTGCFYDESWIKIKKSDGTEIYSGSPDDDPQKTFDPPICSSGDFTLTKGDPGWGDGWNGATVKILKPNGDSFGEYGLSKWSMPDMVSTDNSKSYTEEDTLPKCSSCPAGYHSTSPGSNACVACPSGQYQLGRGATECNACAAGTYNTNSNCIHSVEWKCNPWNGKIGCWFSEISIELTRSDDNQKWTISAGRYGWKDNGDPDYDSQQNHEFRSAYYENGVSDDAEYRYVFREPICSDSPFTLKKIDSYGDGWNGATVKIIKPNGDSFGEYGLAFWSTEKGTQVETLSLGCSSCPSGYRSTSPVSDACAECPSGQYQLGSGATECLTCSPGTYITSQNCIETVEWTCPSNVGDCEFDEISIELTRSNNDQWSIDHWSIPAYKYLFSESGAARYSNHVNMYDNSATGNYQYKYVFREVICSSGDFTLTKKDGGSNGWNGASVKILKPNGDSFGEYSLSGSLETDTLSLCSSCPSGYQSTIPVSNACVAVTCSPGTYITSQNCISRVEWTCTSNSGNCYYEEISFQITESDGTVLHTGNTSSSFSEICSSDDLTLEKMDTWGDGWNWAKLRIFKTDGSLFGEYGLSDGYQGTETISLACNTCPRGFQSTSPVSDACEFCPAGKFGGGQVSCSDCPVGKATKHRGMAYQISCRDCSVGQWAQGGSTCGNCNGQVCPSCSPGSFWSAADDECQACPSGKYQPDMAYDLTACYDCPAGQSSTSNFEGCEGCLTGQYSSNGGPCFDCTNGYTTWNATFTFIRVGSPEIEAEWYITEDEDFGDLLSEWYITPTVQTFAFRSDKQFRIKAVTNDTTNGWKIDNNNYYELSAFSTNGIFKNWLYNHGGYDVLQDHFITTYFKRPFTSSLARVGGDTCVCPPGTHIPFDNSNTGCTQCPLGGYSDTENAEWCYLCDEGTYSDAPGEAACHQCPVGRTTWGQNIEDYQWQQSCKVCPAGKEFNINDYSCELCPEGKFQAGYDDMPIGYYAECEECPTGKTTFQEGSVDCQDMNCSELRQEYFASATTQCTESTTVLKRKWNQKCFICV